MTATVDSSGSVSNTYRYKPYGDQLAKTGASSDPRYLWTGDTGSRKTGLSYAEQYNRARHLGTKQANWTSVDAFWPDLAAYQYANENPATLTDPSGFAPCLAKPCCCDISKFESMAYGPIPAKPTTTISWRIKTEITLEKREARTGEKDGFCLFKWEEKANYKGEPQCKTPVGVWFDIAAFPCLKQYPMKYPFDCPETVGNPDTDSPAFKPTVAGASLDAIRCIRISVTSGCTRKTKIKSYALFARFVGGIVTVFGPPSNSPVTDKYCDIKR